MKASLADEMNMWRVTVEQLIWKHPCEIDCWSLHHNSGLGMFYHPKYCVGRLLIIPWSGKSRTTAPTFAHVICPDSSLFNINILKVFSKYLSRYTICVFSCSLVQCQAVYVCDRRYWNALRYVLIQQVQRDNWWNIRHDTLKQDSTWTHGLCR